MHSPYIVRRKVENTFLVRQRDRRRRHELVAVLVAVVLVGGGLLAYTWIHIEILRIGYRIDGLEKDLHRLEVQERHRRLAIAQLTRPEQVEQRASRELGMQEPTLAQTAFYEELAP